MPSQAEIERKLAQLTVRQCQVLHWVCHDYSLQQIANELHVAIETVNKDMSQIYKLFGFKHMNTHQKRAALFKTICPMHNQKVANPLTDCSQAVIEVGPEPDPDPDILAIVNSIVVNWRFMDNGDSLRHRQATFALSRRVADAIPNHCACAVGYPA